jgi:hypothetical protein
MPEDQALLVFTNYCDRTFPSHLQTVDQVQNQGKAGSRYFCESLFLASQPKQAAKT